MRVLVTGSEGHIGRALTTRLHEAGHELRTLDRVARPRASGDWEHLPGDLRDILTVRRAMQGMDAVMHLGALAHDRAGAPEDVLSVNVQGTWNVLLAAVEAGAGRVVYFSSINALGCVGGHRAPVRFPIDDAYPRHPLSHYQLSKHLAEETCRSYSERHGLVTVALRPGWVAKPEWYERFGRADDPARLEHGKSELWAYVDLRDVVAAAMLALEVENVQHDAFLLFARDTLVHAPTEELVATYLPEVSWTQERAAYFAGNPNRSLMNCSHAETVLGWRALHSWRDAASVAA